MKRQRIPLVGSLTGRNPNPNEFTSFDQKFINCYPEIARNAVTGQGSVKLSKRPGFASNGTVASGYSGMTGGAYWTGAGVAMLPFINSTSLRVYDSLGNQFADTIANAVSGSVAYINETLISNVPTLTLLTQRSTTGYAHAWYAAQGATAWTEITDVDFPPNQNGTVTGAIAGTTLTTTVSSTGVNLPIGAYLSGNGVSGGTRIVAVGTAVAGVGTYTVSVSQTVGSGTIYCGKPIVGEMVHMDGCGYVMDIDGTIYESDLNTLSAWSAIAYVNAQSLPDGGRGLARLKNYIYAFGSATGQLFQNSGASVGARITNVQGGTINIGAVNAGSFPSIKTIGDFVYFTGVDAVSGKSGFYRMQGASAEKISTQYIDKLIQQNATLGVLGGVQLHGMLHIVCTINTAEHPVYCVDTKQWWTWTPGDGKQIASIMPRNARDGVYNAIDQAQTLYMAIPGSTAYVDNATTLTMTIQTEGLDQGTNRKKFYHAAELVCDKQSTSGNISISWSDDDYQNFSTARTIDPSTGTRRITRLGATQRNYNNKRAWKITETVNRPFRGEALELWYEEGGT